MTAGLPSAMKNGGTSCTTFDMRAQHGMGADAAELVHAGAPADVDVILDHHVAGQRRLAAHHEVIADDAVMRDVAVGEDDVVVAEHGEIAVLRGKVHGDVLAKHVAVADAQAGIAAR